MRESQDVGRARATLRSHQQRLGDLEAEFEAETEELRVLYDPTTVELEEVQVRPKKKDIAVSMVALAWAPYWERSAGEAVPAW